MKTDYDLRGTANKQKREYHPLLSSIDGTGSNTMQNHLIVRSKDDKEKEKLSKNSGNSFICILHAIFYAQYTKHVHSNIKYFLKIKL